MIKHAPILFAALALSACTTVHSDAEQVMMQVMPEGSAVGFWTAVAAGDLIVEPTDVIEDSRCPINARCVWAGEIIVEANIFGEGWNEVIQITMGEPVNLHGHMLNLASVEPGQLAGGDPIGMSDYRFTFESAPAE